MKDDQETSVEGWQNNSSQNKHTKVTLFIYSKLTIETLEQGLEYVQIYNEDTRTTSLPLFWYLCC